MQEMTALAQKQWEEERAFALCRCDNHAQMVPESICEALLCFPRSDFLPPSVRDGAYQISRPTRLEGLGFNVSAPSVYVHALEHLQIQEGLGSGCGLLTVLGAVLAGPTGRAHGLEVSAAALRFARRNVQKQINWRAPLLSPTEGVDSVAARLCVGSCFEGEAAIGVDHPTSTHRFVFKVTRITVSGFDAELVWPSRQFRATCAHGRVILSTSPAAQSSALAGPCREERRSPDAGGERGEACGLKHQVRSGGGTMRITETGLARSRARHGKL
eukprot:CAMPEP_0114315896 /NCGR_PEP_ID=MMETSP0059-20121206/22866_1 /TAXON_ID=36894 /ORGANISM="Pyramimonas parkeae, Strain CCMP726" /LENGTH=271 /DNA_ID=CAMNT_0001441695 /DNA_START=436 /DNA_END=1248 /DNA_ORIENTATION=+